MIFVATRLRLVALCALTVAIVLGPGGAAARATFTLTLHEDGVTDQTIIFALSHGDRSSDAPQMIHYSDSFGGFNLVVEVATSNSNIPGATPTLTLNNVQFTNASQAAQTLQLTVTDTGFTTQSIGTGSVDLHSQISDIQFPLGSSVTFQSFLNGTAGNQVSLNGPGVAEEHTTIAAPGNPFTLQNVTTVTVAGASLVQMIGSTEVAAAPGNGPPQVLAPEPSTLGAAISGLPVLGLGLWYRRSRVRRASTNSASA